VSYRDDEDAWAEEEAAELARLDADLEMAEMDAVGDTIAAARKTGRCLHMSAQGYLPGDDRGIRPGQLRCAEQGQGLRRGLPVRRGLVRRDGRGGGPVRYRRYTARLADGTEARFWSPRSKEHAAFDIVRPLSSGPYTIRQHGRAIAERGRLADAKERLERA
jgi:hypothetical protein